MDKTYNSNKTRKVKVELDIDVVNFLIKLKQYGDTYSMVIRRTIMERK